jgi:antitoxin MazE
MKLNLIRIGNSKGIRLPASVIKECGFGDQVEMRVEGGALVITPASGAREGWDEAFASAVADGVKDELLIPDTLDDESDEEWTW